MLCLGGVDEDDGWLLVMVYCVVMDMSDVVIFDVCVIDVGLVVIVYLLCCVLVGFYGVWVLCEC